MQMNVQQQRIGGGNADYCNGVSETKQRRLRIGYLSSDFHEHATAYLIAGVLESHDRRLFEIIAYSYGPNDPTPMRRRLQSAFARFVDMGDLSDQAAAAAIHADAIDILVDLKGYTQHARTGILTFRPAPIQAQYLGYPGTMGTRLVDYLIADRFFRCAAFGPIAHGLPPGTKRPSGRRGGRRFRAIPIP